MAVTPISQTFSIQQNPTAAVSGRFITSIDVFFGAKDATLPVTMELRNVVAGYPGDTVLAFGRVTKNTGDVNISDTGATATT